MFNNNIKLYFFLYININYFKNLYILNKYINKNILIIIY